MSATVTRRSTLTAAIATAAGVVAGYLYGRTTAAAKGTSGARGHTGYGTTSGAATRLAALADVPIGGGTILAGPGVVLTRPSADVVHAFSAVCTHLGCTVNQVRGGRIFCPCHGSVFDAATGAVRQGPAGAPLPPVAVTVRAGGIYTA